MGRFGKRRASQGVNLGLHKLSSKARVGKQQGLVVVGPSGIFTDTRAIGSEGVDSLPLHETNLTSDEEMEMETPVQVVPLTKKEKQAIRWEEAINELIPHFLHTVMATENLARTEEIHRTSTLCSACLETGKAGVKVLCLYFNCKPFDVIVKLVVLILFKVMNPGRCVIAKRNLVKSFQLQGVLFKLDCFLVHLKSPLWLLILIC